METAKLTVRLPKSHIESAKRYARDHEMTVTELIDRLFRRLRTDQDGSKIHPAVEAISGLVPREVDAEAEFHEHLLEKHR